jgi:asparagine synthase (glutamine-hydrolysing)
MINIKITTNNFWKKYNEDNINIWLKGYIYSYSIEKIIKICKEIEKDKISSFIKSIDGHFALVVQRTDLTFIAVDKIRSSQLFFIKIKNDFFIDNDPKRLVKISEFSKEIDKNAKLELAMSGFTIGNKTIYKNLYSLKAGELVIFQGNIYQYSQYYKYFGDIAIKSFDEYLSELSQLTLKIFQKMLNQIGDKQIIIPLSGGHDSRLIASILNYLGAKNVKCYTYGTPGNYEANLAEKIAKKLNYEWKFIPLTHKSEKKYYALEEYNKYLKFSETFSSVPFIQSLSSIKYLKDMDWVSKDAIFINGLSGDFISGGHADIKKNNRHQSISIDSRREDILNQLIEKHFSLWGYLKTEDNLNKIKDNLWIEITKGCGGLTNENQDHLFYEYSEFIDRQSKYVIKKQKVYEFYEHQWRLPFWDEEYLMFWQKVPLSYKLKQKLYKEMLKKNNFGGVWNNDFFSDKKNITPRWIIPLRFICKIPFSFFGKCGKSAWKQFDINFFKYFTSIPHTWDMFNYIRIIKDIFKGPRNSVSWQSEDYLKIFKERKN